MKVEQLIVKMFFHYLVGRRPGEYLQRKHGQCLCRVTTAVISCLHMIIIAIYVSCIIIYTYIEPSDNVKNLF